MIHDVIERAGGARLLPGPESHAQLAENVYRLLMEILSVCLDEIGLSGLEGKWKMTITFMA